MPLLTKSLSNSFRYGRAIELSCQYWYSFYGDFTANVEDNYGSSIDYDSDGNIYITSADGITGSPCVVKYNPFGQIIWQKKFNEPNDYYKTADALRVANNNVYCTLGVDDSTKNTTLFKLDLDGNIIWQKTISETISVFNFAGGDIAIDSLGNVIVLCYTRYFGDTSYNTIIKFDSLGNLLWQTKIPDGLYFCSIVTDSNNDIYFSTEMSNFTPGGISVNSVIVKLSSAGSLIWQKQYANPYNSSTAVYSAYVSYFTIDSSNNLYVVGDLRVPPDSPSRQVCLYKLNSSGDLIWQTNIENTSPFGWAMGIDLDSSNNIYINWFQQFSPDRLNDFGIAKFDNNGNLIWARALGGTGDERSYYYWAGNTIKVFQNNYAITGYSYSFTGSTLAETFTAQLPIDGSLTASYENIIYQPISLVTNNIEMVIINGTKVPSSGNLIVSAGNYTTSNETNQNSLKRICSGGGPVPPIISAMTLIYDTSLSPTKEIQLPLNGFVNVTVYWGDGFSETFTSSGIKSHTYSVNKKYIVSITGTLTHFGTDDLVFTSVVNPESLISVVSWGSLGLTSLFSAFKYCINLTSVPTTLPSTVTTLAYTFHRCESFNQNISTWDITNVTSLEGTFLSANSFNQPLNTWNTSNVTTMELLFDDAVMFNQPLNNWDVSNVTNMRDMFGYAETFDQNINNWDVSSVTDMTAMFNGAFEFNQPLNNWNVSNVTNMRNMFSNTFTFNQPLNNWDVSSVTNMSYMFNSAIAFNQSLNDWDVSNVYNMSGMFGSFPSFSMTFNQPLNNWNVSNVYDMTYMFENSIVFNQNISNWCVPLILSEPFRFSSNCPLPSIFKPQWGLCPGPAQIVISPTVVTYIMYLPGGQSDPQTITLTNTGESTAEITNISLSSSVTDIATPIPDWTGLGGSPVTTIAPGASKTFTLAFNPISYGTFLSLDGIRVFYKENEEVYSETSGTVSVAPIQNFDFAVLRYTWIESGGSDLDTRTSLINTGTSYDNLPVGWCKYGTSGNSQGAIVGPPGSVIVDGIVSGPYYLFWGGDNTSSSGGEAVLVDFPQISNTFPSLTEISIDLRAFWFGSRNSGFFSIQFTTYLGGTMQRDGYNFINVGGTVVDNFSINFNSLLNVSDCITGQCFKNLVYTVATKNAILVDCPTSSAMELVYNTAESNTSTTEIQVPLSGTVNVTIDWGDGNTQVVTAAGNISHTYAINGVYTVRITGSLTRFGSDTPIVNPGSLIECLSWGNLGLTSLSYAFWNCNTLMSVPTNIPSTVTDLSGMFDHATSFNQNINSWDVSNVTQMYSMFTFADSFDASLDSWNVSNVTDMSAMFSHAVSFNRPLCSWDVSNVENMSQMFNNASSFNQDISNWCVTNITSEPGVFSTGSPLLNVFKPVWGTCPGTGCNANSMILVYDTSLSPTREIELPLNGTGTYNVIIDWGDGQSNSFSSTGEFLYSHTYSTNGVYTVKISGILPHFGTTNYGTTVIGASSLVSVQSFGNLGLTSLKNAFYDCQNLSSVPATLPNGITNLSYTFARCFIFNSNINSWDVSSVTTLEGMFVNAEAFNQPLNSWNTSNVTNMAFTFNVALAFNQPLNNWNTSNVTTLESTFDSAEVFNQNINNWNTSSVTNMMTTFAGAKVFNQPLNNWNVSNVTDMTAMFQCTPVSGVFNQNISNWCVNLISTEPSNFSLGVPLISSYKPVWGTCP